MKCGIVDQGVETAEFLESAIDQRFAVPVVLDVAGRKDCFSVGIADQTRSLVRVLFFIQIGNQNIGALSRAKASATARPIPLSPPVINAFLSFSRPKPL